MAYKKDDNGGQAAASSSPSSSASSSGSSAAGGSYSKSGSSSAGKSYASSKASAKASTRISGAGSRDSSAHAAASADRAAAAGRGKVAKFTPSVRGGTSGSSGGKAASPAWVGKNPYQWGNTSTIVNHWDDRDPERQAKLNALGFAADDPDRTFHFYEPDKGSPKSYLEKANALSSDRNYYQAGNFWNTINGQYASEDDRKADAMEWMKDAQIYGAWARDHDLTYTDENGEEKSMEEAWKEIWSYANDIAGGIGDSDSARAGKEIQAYLTGGEYNSADTRRLMEQARQFSENADSEKDARYWADLEKSLNIQLKDDEKREKREGSFLGKAGNLWDSFIGSFERPERAEQGELTDTQKAYQQAAAEYQMYSGWATDPLSAAAFAPAAERRNELAEAVKAENREAGREVYAGMAPEDRLSDMTESWLGGRGAGTVAGAAGGLYAVDSVFYDNDEIRELTQRKFIADQNLLTTGDQKYREESEALQAQIDEAQRRANENGENGTPLGDAAGMLLDSARGMQTTADQQWRDATEDMSEGEKFLANVGKTGADVAADIVENTIAPGVGTMRMYLGAGGSGAMEQAGREQNDPDSIATATITRAASAWLSTKLVGGMESAYGQSILGGITERAFANASPAVQAAAKTLLNTEWVEEGLEDILNYAGDLILGLNEEAQLNWDEVKQDALVGYVLGVLTNGLSAGINYNSKARHALAEEAVEFAQSGLSIEEAAEIGKESTKEDIVMKPQPESAYLQAVSQNAAIEGQDQNVVPAPENVNAQDTGVSSQVTPEQAAEMAQSQTAALEGQGTSPQAAPAQTQAVSDAEVNDIINEVNSWGDNETNAEMAGSQSATLAGQDTNPVPAPNGGTPAQQDVIDILMNPTGENGTISNSQAKTILGNPELLEAFEQLTGTTPETGSNSAARNSVKDAGAKFVSDWEVGQEARGRARASMEIDDIIDEVMGWSSEKTQPNIDNAANVEYNNLNNADSGVNANDATGSVGKNQGGIPGVREAGGAGPEGRNGSDGTPVGSGIVLLSDEAKATLNGRGVEAVDLQDQSADTAAFSAALDAARNADQLHGWAVTPKTVEDLSTPGMKVMMAANGTAGLAVAPDGDIEAVFANKSAGAPKGVTKSTIPQAIANGGTKLDCYGAGLVKLYSQYGFIPVARVKFNPEYANPGWDASKGNPDIYFMMHNGDNSDTVVQKHGQYPEFSAEQLASLPEMEYDDAYAYRDSLLEQQIGEASNAETFEENPFGIGTEPEATSEPATESTTEAQENPAEVNSQPEETNASEDVLNAQEIGESGNPLLDTVVESLGRRSGPNINENADTNQRGTPKEKVSEVSTNTLQREEGANYRGDLTYTPHPQEQLILDAYAKIGEDPSGTVRDLMKPGMWTDAQVKAGKIVRDTLYQEAASTGDYSAYDAWRKITQEHSTPVAQSLAAMRADPELTAERLYDNSNKFLDEIEAGEVAGVRGVDAKVVAEARKNVSDISGKIARLELEQKSAAKSGKTNKQAWEQVKERYLDLADEINSIRHVGLIVDARKNKAIRKGQQDIDTSLHDMLGKESEDYIKRYVNLAAAGIANDVKYRGKISADKVAKYVNGLQKLCQLGTTGTTLRNLEGNASFGVFNWASDNTGGVVMDQLLSLFTGQRSLGLQAGVFGKRERAAAKTAARRSVLEIAANIDLLDNGSGSKYGVTGNLTVNPYSTNPINRFYARAQQGLSYALNTSDAFFYGMQQESAANAAKRANKNLTDEQAQAIGRQTADYSTFKNDTFISKILEEFQAAADVIGWGGEVTRLGIVPVQRKGGFGLGTLMAPYIKVPVNIVLKAAEFSPIGGAVGAVHAAQAVSAAKSGNADAILMQNRAAAEMGRGVFGTGVLLALAALMKEADWFKNWNDEDDPDVKAQNKAEGKYGLQINLDMFRNALLGKPHGDWSSGKKVNIDSIEPLNAILAEASLIADWNQGITVDAIKHAVSTGTLDGIRDLPAISSISTIADTMTYNKVYIEDEEGNRVEDTGATFGNALAAGFGNSLSGFVPGALRHAARIADDYDRDTSGDTATEQAVNQFKAAVPGLRETLPVKTDNFGNPVSTGSVGTRIANNLLANKYNDVEQGELSKEVERLRTETGVSLMPSKNGPSTVKFGDETARLTREQRREWKNDYGQEFSDTVDLLMRSSIYRDADDDLKASLMKEIGSYVKDGVKADFGKENGYEVKKKYDYLDDVDNPITFLTAKKAFDIAEENEQWDVVDTLIGPVGKLSEDERELMRDKNSTLMSYYDYLTPNDRGYKVKDAATVRAYKAGTKANAEARGKQSPSGQDKFGAIYNGYLDKTFTDSDIDAIMSKAKTSTDEETGEETVRWDVTKGRAAVYLAMRAGGATVREALDATKNADVDEDGTVDEKGVKIKAEYEGTNALKRSGVQDQNSMWYEFNEIMYPWKNK